MFDFVATETAIRLLEDLAADPEIPDEARFILVRALNRLDDQIHRA